MAGLLKRLERAMASQTPTYYNGELYKPECHYMRGPGPACKAKEKRSSSKQPPHGSDSRLAVASSGLTRVSPDPLSALLRRS